MQPLTIGFQANQEKQGRKTEREIQHEATSHGIAKSSHAMPNSICQIQNDSSSKTNLEHFLEPLYTYYISFRSLGSQESNALNGVQIGAEMKKLWSFEDNCTKLKMNFATLNLNAKFSHQSKSNVKISQQQIQMQNFRNSISNLRNLPV